MLKDVFVGHFKDTHRAYNLKHLAQIKLYKVFLFFSSLYLFVLSNYCSLLRCFNNGPQIVWYLLYTFLATSFKVLKTMTFLYADFQLWKNTSFFRARYDIILHVNQSPSFSENRPFLHMFIDKIYHIAVLKSVSSDPKLNLNQCVGKSWKFSLCILLSQIYFEIIFTAVHLTIQITSTVLRCFDIILWITVNNLD